MSENINLEQQIENKEPVVEQVVSKSKTYVKKGGSARGRKPNPDKKTAYGLPTDEEYFKKYYQEKLSVKVECEICKLYVTKANLKKHKLSLYHLQRCSEHQRCLVESTTPKEITKNDESKNNE